MALAQQKTTLALPRAQLFTASIACLMLACAWWVTMPRDMALGWDESMHAALPGARLALGARALAPAEMWDALSSCAQYPFVYPVFLALVQLPLGISEFATRGAGIAVHAFALLGLFELTREIVARRRTWRDLSLAPWLALFLGAVSPLAAGFAPTLFLETPSAAAAVWTMRAWIRRDGSRRRDLVAGAWIAIAIFTKWNYGLLLAAALVVDALVTFVLLHARRTSTSDVSRAALVRGWLWTALPVLVIGAWWFVLPLPGGVELAAQHREALFGFLGGNTQLGAHVPFGRRLLHAAVMLTPTPRVLCAALLGLVAAVVLVRDGRVRVLTLALACAWIPVLAHPFHLERFFLPGAPFLWVLSALGCASVLPSTALARTAVLSCAVVVLFVAPASDGTWLAERVGVLSDRPEVRRYQLEIFATRRALFDDRALPTAGLARREHDALLDAVAADVGPHARVAWLNVSSELSPATLHLGLLARGGLAERFRRDAHRALDVAYFDPAPSFDEASFLEFARGFDVWLHGDPPDLKRRPARSYFDACRAILQAHAVEEELLGTFACERPLQAPSQFRLFACRLTR